MCSLSIGHDEGVFKRNNTFRGQKKDSFSRISSSFELYNYNGYELCYVNFTVSKNFYDITNIATKQKRLRCFLN